MACIHRLVQWRLDCKYMSLDRYKSIDRLCIVRFVAFSCRRKCTMCHRMRRLVGKRHFRLGILGSACKSIVDRGSSIRLVCRWQRRHKRKRPIGMSPRRGMSRMRRRIHWAMCKSTLDFSPNGWAIGTCIRRLGAKRRHISVLRRCIRNRRQTACHRIVHRAIGQTTREPHLLGICRHKKVFSTWHRTILA